MIADAEGAQRPLYPCLERAGPVAIRNLLPPVLEYIRPGGGKLTTAEEVMAQ